MVLFAVSNADLCYIVSIVSLVVEKVAENTLCEVMSLCVSHHRGCVERSWLEKKNCLFCPSL